MPVVISGWLVLPYNGHDLSQVFISVDDMNDWKPAFLDWRDGNRIAKIRVPAPTGNPRKVWLKVNESVTVAGRVIH